MDEGLAHTYTEILMHHNRLIVWSSLVVLATGCATSGNAPAPGERVTYQNAIASMVERQCSECHGKDSPTMEAFEKDKERYKKDKIGPRFDSYENLMIVVNGADTGALMRRLDDGANTKDGKPGNMYNNLGETDAERATNLALVKRWIGGWTLKRVKDISAAERVAIVAPRD